MRKISLEFIKLIIINYLLIVIRYYETFKQELEIPKPSTKCFGPACYIPFPRLCKNYRTICTWINDNNANKKCAKINVYDCKCPPPLKTIFGGSLGCNYITTTHNYSKVYNYIPKLKENLGSFNSITELQASHLTVNDTNPKLKCTCDKLYKWSTWESWSSWTLICTSKNYFYRRRYQSCKEIKQDDTQLIETHLCSTDRSGNPLHNRVEEQINETNICPKRSNFISSKKGEKLTTLDYILLGLSVLLLLLIIAGLVLILKTVPL